VRTVQNTHKIVPFIQNIVEHLKLEFLVIPGCANTYTVSKHEVDLGLETVVIKIRSYALKIKKIRNEQIISVEKIG
jgi:hypothetical protein